MILLSGLYMRPLKVADLSLVSIAIYFTFSALPASAKKTPSPLLKQIAHTCSHIFVLSCRMKPSDERAFFPERKTPKAHECKNGLEQKERHRAKITRGILLHGCGFIVASWNQRRKTNGGAPRNQSFAAGEEKIVRRRHFTLFRQIAVGAANGRAKSPAPTHTGIVLQTEKCVSLQARCSRF